MKNKRKQIYKRKKNPPSAKNHHQLLPPNQHPLQEHQLQPMVLNKQQKKQELYQKEEEHSQMMVQDKNENNLSDRTSIKAERKDQKKKKRKGNKHEAGSVRKEQLGSSKCKGKKQKDSFVAGGIEKFGICFLGILLLFFFSGTKFSSQEVKGILQAEYQETFQIVAQKVIQPISLPIKDSQRIVSFLPFQSTKSGIVEAALHMRLGFEIENIDILDGEYGAGSVSVSFTDLKVLSHDIKDIRLVNKENGFFNQWQFEDHQKLHNEIEYKHYDSIERLVLNRLSENEKVEKKKKTAQIVYSLISAHDSWLNRLLRSVNNLFKSYLFGMSQNVEKLPREIENQRITCGKYSCY